MGLGSKTKLAPDQSPNHQPSTPGTNLEHVADHPIDAQTQQLTENVHTDNKAHYVDYTDDADNSKFVAMWHYLHESNFDELSPALQTRKLHELFRYKYTNTLVERLKNHNFKIPTGKYNI